MPNRFFIRSIPLVLALCLALSACAGAAPASTAVPTKAPLTLTDGLKNTITLPAPAARVVSLAPSNTEILFAVGAGSQVVGRDEFSDYPNESKQLPSVGGSMGKYNPEAIVSLKPDLVLAAEINPPELVESLKKLGLTVFLLPNPTDLDGMYQNLATVGKLTGHEAEAVKLSGSLQDRVKAVQQKIMPLSSHPPVFYELDATDPNAPYTAGKGTFVDLLIEQAGGHNVGSSLDQAWAQISTEKLLVENPQVILLGDSAYGVTPESVGQRTGWSDLAAVKSNQIYPFDDNLVSRPGPRLVDGLEAMAKIIHPEVFK